MPPMLDPIRMIKHTGFGILLNDAEKVIPLSNAIRLTARQWVVVALFGLLLAAGASPTWKRFEVLELPADARLPHDLGNDYWLYQRHVDAARQCDAVLFGDSVVWGEYARRDQTLSHYLNVQAGTERFANLGLDGAHPLALTGLVEFHARSIVNKNAILHCNPLWFSSPRADLRDGSANDFNHPRLVPQFAPTIPALKDEISTRLGNLVEQRWGFSQWTNHLQQAYYDRADIPGWTLEHPYACPIEPLTRGLLSTADDPLRHLQQSWVKSGIAEQDYPWVDLETSLQWRAFQRVVQILRSRENRIFVLVGPFNEHLLSPGSLARYRRVKDGIAEWLTANDIPHRLAEPLPSEQYGDASHPLPAGYETLARTLRNLLE